MSSDSNEHHPTEQPAQAPVDDKSSKPKLGVVSPRQRYIAHHQQQRSREEEVKNPVTVSPSAASSNAASSITDTHLSDDLSTIQKAYRQYKQARKHQRCSSLTTLHEIIEDVQFFGLYICGELLNDAPEATDDENNDKDATISKEERKKAMDTTFLGKMIECGGIHHHDGCFGGDCILSCHDTDDDARDDCSGEFL